MNEEMIEKAIKLSSKSYTDNYYTDKFRQEAFRLKNELEQEKEKNKKLEKVIDRMAKQISCLSRNLDNATNFERVSEEEYNVDFIKQYYFKKVRGEENG